MTDHEIPPVEASSTNGRPRKQRSAAGTKRRRNFAAELAELQSRVATATKLLKRADSTITGTGNDLVRIAVEILDNE